MIVAGIDAGSRTVKVVLLDADRIEIVTSAIADQGVKQATVARRLFEGLLKEQQLDRPAVSRIVATGYGRNLIRFADETITEITCHAYGVRHVAPDARTIIEIGGQDSKFIRLSPKGAVQDFAMNDRCAAGTGRFLEVVAVQMGVELDALDELARKSTDPAAISSMCVVFAETEVVGLLAAGTPPEDIVAGIQASLARRVAGLAGRNVDEPVYLTGGVALVPGMANALASAIGHPVAVAPDPQMTGALGAAILAARRERC